MAWRVPFVQSQGMLRSWVLSHLGRLKESRGIIQTCLQQACIKCLPEVFTPALNLAALTCHIDVMCLVAAASSADECGAGDGEDPRATLILTLLLGALDQPAPNLTHLLAGFNYDAGKVPD